MLEIKDVSLQVGSAPDAVPLLSEISARFPRRHFVAVIGPSGCGKSTLLKMVAGLREPTNGHVAWDGVDLAEEDMAPQEIGYVPQFGIAYELLTVWENVEAALRLRVSGLDAEAAEVRIEQILHDVGLSEIGDRRVSLLSGGQRRRLALALEMVSSPQLLLVDEVTSGLDPKAEDEMVKLLHRLSRSDERIVLSVTHSLRHLALYDSVVVLYEGHLAYHGAADTLFHYFGVETPEELFPRLAMRSPEDWNRSWAKYRSVYYSAAGLEAAELPAEPDASPAKNSAKMPSAFLQFSVILARRWRLFFRDRAAMLLHLALLIGFPCLVVIFALDGLPQVKTLEAPVTGNFLEQMQNEASQLSDLARTGGLISGLVMFQVILLALAGSNNAAREIASERLIFEKEKFAGLRPSAYIASKAAFLGVLVLAQSLWMGLFVNFVVRFPGNLPQQVLVLIMVNAAVTATCLAISSLMRSAEQASLVSVYLVGFQLPLSGAVLALPRVLDTITRPFIASYWGWSGFINTMHDTRSYGAVAKVTHPHLSPVSMCLWVLGFHALLGLFLAYTGSKNSRWD